MRKCSRGLIRGKLTYLQRHPKTYIHAMFAPTDALLYFGQTKLITSLDLHSSNPTFTYVIKQDLIRDMGLNEGQFLDMGILAGFDHSQTFPPTIHEQSLKPTIDMIKYYKTGFSAVTALAEHPGVKQTQYTEQFTRTQCMIRFSLILSTEGIVQPLPLTSGTGTHYPHINTAADIPVDLHEIFTHRLPDEVYFYLSRGLIGPQALIWLTSGQVVENPPLDNGETTEYRRFVKEVITEGATGPRATALALVSSVMNNFWQQRKVQAFFWFEPHTYGTSKGVVHNGSNTGQLVERVASWTVSSAVVEEELRRQNVS